MTADNNGLTDEVFAVLTTEAPPEPDEPDADGGDDDSGPVSE